MKTIPEIPIAILVGALALLSGEAIYKHEASTRDLSPVESITPIPDINPMSKDITRSMPETSMTLNFLSPKTWAALEHKGLIDPNTGGFTVQMDHHCQIFLRSNDFTISAAPRTGYARWKESRDDIISHEALHCLAGPWHRPWNEILKDKVAKDYPGFLFSNKPLNWNNNDYLLQFRLGDISEPVMELWETNGQPHIYVMGSPNLDETAKKFLFILHNSYSFTVEPKPREEGKN